MTTKLAAVIGWPVGHSLSPRLHGHWLAEHGVDGAYVKLPVRREDFGRVLDGLRRAGLSGVNVTIPHKEAAFALAHTLDDAASAAGSANLLVFAEDGRIHARNTDASGLKASLVAGAGAEFLRGRPAVLLGAGGAARAAILALAELGAREIRIVNRSPGRAEGLAKAFAAKSPAQIVPALWSDWGKIASDAALLLNTTSAGMAGNPPLGLPLEALASEAVVCDIVYNPLETPLLKEARARGHVTVDGLGMLMYQAVPAFSAFYGVTPSVTPALRAELEKALRHG